MPTSKADIYVGPAGWSYPDWNGVVYPKPKPSGFSELAYLARFFDTLEINSTFYRLPSKNSVESWAASVSHNPRFRFCVKLWQKFTHEEEGYSSAEVAAFCETIEPLRSRGLLACLLLQYPWRFKCQPENLNRVADLLGQLGAFSCMVEFRHASWYCSEAFTVLRDHGAGFANIDQPVIGESLLLTDLVTADIGYLRLHGRNYENWFKEDAGRNARYDYLYSDEELRVIGNSIDEIAQKSKTTFVVFNNHFRGQAVINSFQILAKLTNAKVIIPSILLEHYPILRSVGKSESVDGMLSLF